MNEELDRDVQIEIDVLASYIMTYISEEEERGNMISSWTIKHAIEAYLGGAAEC